MTVKRKAANDKEFIANTPVNKKARKPLNNMSVQSKIHRTNDLMKRDHHEILYTAE